jgi:hypothetical protein
MQHNSANKFFDSLASGRAVAINHGRWQRSLSSGMTEMGNNFRRWIGGQFDRGELQLACVTCWK